MVISHKIFAKINAMMCTAKIDLDNESQLFNLNVGYFMRFNVFSTIKVLSSDFLQYCEIPYYMMKS